MLLKGKFDPKKFNSAVLAHEYWLVKGYKKWDWLINDCERKKMIDRFQQLINRLYQIKVIK